MKYHNRKWLSKEELIKYNEKFVWCNKCGHKHQLETKINHKHSDKCQLIPKICNNESDHCYKYKGNIFEGIFTIVDNKYINILIQNIENLKGDWKDWITIGGVSIYECIICKKQKKRTDYLMDKKDIEKFLIINKYNNDLQSKEDIKKLLIKINKLERHK